MKIFLKKACCIIVLGLVLLFANTSAAFSSCDLVWSGDYSGSEPTAETERTINAAEELALHLIGNFDPDYCDLSCSDTGCGIWCDNYLNRAYAGASFPSGTWSNFGANKLGMEWDYEGTWDVVCDGPPAVDAGPFLAAGPWPVLPSDQNNPMILDQNFSVLWTFSDDKASCSEEPTLVAEVQAEGDGSWTVLDADPGFVSDWYAGYVLPVQDLQNATTYAIRFTITDCSGQSTQSEESFFRVSLYDDPPVIESGPFLAAGPWPVLPTVASEAFLLDQNYDVLWTFSDDYASCDEACTHRARYRLIGEEDWIWLTVNTDPEGEWYAYTELPIDSLPAGTYQFQFDVADCASQYTFPPHYYYFKLVH